MTVAQEETLDSELRVIIFRLADRLFGMKIDYVREVLEYREPTSVPNSPAWLAGVLSINYRILPVASMAHCLQIEQNGKQHLAGHLLTIEVSGQEMALTADEVTAIRTFNTSEVTKPDTFTVNGSLSLLDGIIREDGNEDVLILLVNPENLVDSEMMRQAVDYSQECDMVSQGTQVGEDHE